MFYEEREFDDVWHYRMTPGGQWIRGRLYADAPMTAPPAGALELPERVLAMLAQHGGWQATLNYIAQLEAGNIAYSQQVAELIGRVGNAENAALRLREGCEGLVADWREVATDDDRKASGRGNNQWFRSSANANRICADDLARVLEEG